MPEPLARCGDPKGAPTAAGSGRPFHGGLSKRLRRRLLRDSASLRVPARPAGSPLTDLIRIPAAMSLFTQRPENDSGVGLKQSHRMERLP
jgi:hypothetical protein